MANYKLLLEKKKKNHAGTDVVEKLQRHKRGGNITQIDVKSHSPHQ
jgi:hypothetical protein